MNEEVKNEIESLQTENGGWTKESLAKLGISWPPPKGWREFLETKGQAKPMYNKSRFPKQFAKGLCRGCGGSVPKGRQTWCSRFCWDRFEPSRVKLAVRNRDQHICQICSTDIRLQKQAWLKNREESENRFQFQLSNPKPREEYDHIVPFSEGGLTVVENMRTLCTPCHKQRTREWHKTRK